MASRVLGEAGGSSLKEKPDVKYNNKNMWSFQKTFHRINLTFSPR